MSKPTGRTSIWKKALFTIALCATPFVAHADATGAYARTTNNGTYDTYMIVTQRGNTVLVTLNILYLLQPGLFNGTQNTSIFAYGIGTLDPTTQTTRITMSSFVQGSCYSILEIKFGNGSLTKTGVGGTCNPNTSATETFQLAF